jgi:LuxR family transcriptional regulator, capsular biosynthesis positive transcription factor
MNIVLIDHCKYTQLGMRLYLSEIIENNDQITLLNDVDTLTTEFSQLTPGIVFLSEQYINNEQPFAGSDLQALISRYPETLFCILMSMSVTEFNEIIHIKDNVIIASKAIKASELEHLVQLRTNNHYRTRSNSQFNRLLSLSKTEYDMVRMWMAGIDTSAMCEKMNIKPKTLSSHKGNIKRKIKTHNKQVIYQVIRLTEMLTPEIFLNRAEH